MAGQRHVRLFRNGRNQAVRIPVEFELPSNEAIVYRDGDRLVIQPGAQARAAAAPPILRVLVGWCGREDSNLHGSPR